MPAAETTRGRLRQVERWLRHHYPMKRPVRVRVDVTEKSEGKRDDGLTYRLAGGGPGLVILLNNELLAPEHDLYLVEVLIHEWAHGRVWRVDLEDDHRAVHRPEWALEYGLIYQHYCDRGGWRGSHRFSPRPWR